MAELTTRRSFLFGAACLAAAGLTGCTRSSRSTATRTPTPTGTSAAPLVPVDCPATEAAGAGSDVPLWITAVERGLVYGSSTATWQISDAQYRKLYEREARRQSSSPRTTCSGIAFGPSRPRAWTSATPTR